MVSKGGWISDKRKDVAVYFRNRSIRVKKTEPEEGYYTIHLADMAICFCYLSPNIDIVTLEERMGPIFERCGELGGDYLIIGDMNLKDAEWGSTRPDAQGEYIMEQLVTRNLIVLNNSDTPTFVRI